MMLAVIARLADCCRCQDLEHDLPDIRKPVTVLWTTLIACNLFSMFWKLLSVFGQGPAGLATVTPIR